MLELAYTFFYKNSVLQTKAGVFLSFFCRFEAETLLDYREEFSLLLHLDDSTEISDMQNMQKKSLSLAYVLNIFLKFGNFESIFLFKDKKSVFVDFFSRLLILFRY